MLKYCCYLCWQKQKTLLAMNNLTTFASTNQLLKLDEAHVIMDDSRNINPVFYSEEEVKLLLEERLKSIAEGTAVFVQHEEVKNHIKSMLHEEHQMA